MEKSDFRGVAGKSNLEVKFEKVDKLCSSTEVVWGRSCSEAGKNCVVLVERLKEKGSDGVLCRSIL